MTATATIEVVASIGAVTIIASNPEGCARLRYAPADAEVLAAEIMRAARYARGPAAMSAQEGET